MTAEEFLNLYAELGVFNSLKKPEPMHEWQKEKNSISPHIRGTMPKAIEANFPNETESQRLYRERIYRSETMPRLNQAIEDVRKMVIGGRFAIDSSAEVEQLLMNFRYEGLSVIDYVFEVVFPSAVEDPNGLFIVYADEMPEAQNQPYKTKFAIVPSSDIVYYEPEELIVCKYRRKEQPTTASLVDYFVFSPDFFGIFEPGANEFKFLFNNPSQFVFCKTLGGKPFVWRNPSNNRNWIVNKSFFFKAVGAMDRLEVLTAQLDASTATTCFPTRISRSLECHVCEGKKEVPKIDPETGLPIYEVYTKVDFTGQEVQHKVAIMETCSTCHGTGKLTVSQLDTINVPRQRPSALGEQAAEIPLSDYIHYSAPSTETLNFLAQQQEKQKENVDEVLNLVRPSRQAESGIAKEKDREGKETALVAIAENIAETTQFAIEAMLRWQYGLATNLFEAEIAALNVIVPKSFEISSEASLRAELIQNSENKPLFLAEFDATDFATKRFAEREGALYLFELVKEYTLGMLAFNPNQISSLQVTGLATKEQAQKATFAYPIAQAYFKKYMLENGGDMPSKEELFAFLDARFEAILAANPEPMTMQNFDQNGQETE